MSDERESRALAYILECISFRERDVRDDPEALDDIGRPAPVMDALPPLKAVVEAELAALRRDR